MRLAMLAALIVVLLVVPAQAEAQLFPTGFPSATPETAAPLAPPDLSAFVGGWGGHGRGLTIEPSGRAQYRYRTYTWCAPGMTIPCDRIENSVITSGGSANFTFTSSDGPTLRGRIDEASDPARFPKGGPVRLVVGENGLAELTWGETDGGPGITLCGARFVDAPEDVRRTFPCGA